MTDLYVPRHTIWVDTSSGSRYRIDPGAMIWTRESHDPRSDAVRSGDGELKGLGERPRVGRRLIIIGPGYALPSTTRVVTTTPVVRIHHAEPAERHRAVEGWGDGSENAPGLGAGGGSLA